MSARVTGSHCFVNPSWAPDTLHFIVLRNPPAVLSTEKLFKHNAEQSICLLLFWKLGWTLKEVDISM